MKKITSLSKSMKKVKMGDTIMIGGFLTGGNPDNLVKALLETDVKDLTIISSDTGTTKIAKYDLIKSGKLKKIYASYIGANPESGRMYITGDVEVELVPQGTLAERIRAGGAGLGGVLTPTGVGTMVERGKQKIKVDDKEYLLEKSLRANVALIKANIADELGNLVIKGSAKNFNVVMAMAADYVVVEVSKIVKVGEIEPDHITIPSIFVDAIVKVGD